MEKINIKEYAKKHSNLIATKSRANTEIINALAEIITKLNEVIDNGQRKETVKEKSAEQTGKKPAGKKLKN